MDEANPGAQPDLDAGEFGPWLSDVGGAIRSERGSEVPCDACTACCTSSQFIHIRPDEADTLAHIPSSLLFPAPGRPRGHVLLGYDELGHCPMLIDGRCSIYEHRPMTCRTYDCRIFPATGVELDDEGKGGIAARASRWEFRFTSPTDVARFDGLRTAAAFLREHPDVLPDEVAPRTPTQLAVLAIEVHAAFLGEAEDGATIVVRPDPVDVRAEVARRNNMAR